MPEREPMTQTIKASQARARWSDLLNQVFRRQMRVIVEKSGIPVAAIVPAQDLERLHQLEQQRLDRFKVLDQIGAAFRDQSPEQIEREAAQAIAEVRAEQAPSKPTPA